MIVVFFLTKDRAVAVMMLVSAFLFLTDYIFWMMGSPYYYERHINKDLILMAACFMFGRKDFTIAGIICFSHVCLLMYEALSPYQTFLTPYVHTIQIVMMQLYLLALTYKSEWKLPCRRQQKM
jgi:hypothetical protein